MDNNYKPNKKVKLVHAILELILALGLVGFAIYYYVIGAIDYFWLLLAFGVLFIVTSCWSLYKQWKQKKAEEAENNDSGGDGKNDGSGKGNWDMNTVGGNKK